MHSVNKCNIMKVLLINVIILHMYIIIWALHSFYINMTLISSNGPIPHFWWASILIPGLVLLSILIPSILQ